VEDVVLVAAARTPFGKLGGGLSTLTAPDLGGCVIREVLSRAHVEGADVDEVIMGTVITAGIGQIPARQAAIKAGVPTSADRQQGVRVVAQGRQPGRAPDPQR